MTLILFLLLIVLPLALRSALPPVAHPQTEQGPEPAEPGFSESGFSEAVPVDRRAFHGKDVIRDAEWRVE